MQMTKFPYLDTETDLLLERSRQLKSLIKKHQEELNVINRRIACLACYTEDNRQGYVCSPNYTAKVVNRSRITWDRDKLWELCKFCGDTLFFSMFRTEIKPANRELIERYLRTETPVSRAIAAARIIEPREPLVYITVNKGGNV